MRALALQNCPVEGFGRYADLLDDRGLELDVVQAWRGETLPAIDGIDVLVIGGTPVSANTADDHAFLQAEAALLGQAVEQGRTCLGICCGAQLLARELGATVRVCDTKEIGGCELELTQDGRSDSLLRGFPARFPVFQWHGETFDVPADARLLATGGVCRNQLFRTGGVVGLQFHLEVTSEEAGAWADAYADELRRFGKSRDAVVSECRSEDAAMAHLAEQLVDNLLELAGGH